VPPKDANAITRALELVFHDGELRRSLIRNGLRSARRLIVDRFVDVVEKSLDGQSGERSS
jgi:hypothetical protein